MLSGCSYIAGAPNGGNINRDLVKTEDFPGAVAVDAGHIYWVNREGDTIARASLDGRHVDYELIKRRPGPWGEFQSLLVHGRYIYWVPYGSTRIGRAKIDGTHVNPRFVNVGTVKRFVEVRGLAAKGNHLYWSDEEAGGTIGRVNLNGKHLRKRFVVGLGAVGSIAAYGKHLYWVNLFWGMIGRCDLKGKHRIRRFVVGPPAGASIAVGAEHIYWTGGAMIGRARIDGRHVNPSFVYAGVEDEYGLEAAPAGLALGP